MKNQIKTNLNKKYELIGKYDYVNSCCDGICSCGINDYSSLLIQKKKNVRKTTELSSQKKI
jgi:hypothetical protein